MLSFFKSKAKKLVQSFAKLKGSLGRKLKNIFSKPIDSASYEELEKLFYESDLGVDISMELVEKIKDLLRKDPSLSSEKILKVIADELIILLKSSISYELTASPFVILIVGVNGSGKTTSIAKLANYYKDQKKKVLLVAADTYRAAAVDQLDLWAKKIGVDIVRAQSGADPSSVVFDGLSSAKAKGYDVVLIDTAGRQQNKTHLMNELEKMKRVCHKVIEDSPHEILITLDATTGQHAVDQATVFHEFTPIDGIILSKLDGTAKGGIIIAIKKKLNLPVKWVGTGETADDLAPFDAKKFVEALVSIEE